MNKLIRCSQSAFLIAVMLAIAFPVLAQKPPPGESAIRNGIRDVGLTAIGTPITTSIILKIRHQRELANFIQATLTPGSPEYHHFLPVAQFRERFAPPDEEIRHLKSYLNSYGIHVKDIYADHLVVTVSGTAAEFNAALSTEIHDYTKNGRRFHRPAWQPSLPGDLAALVLAVPGLNSEPGRFHSMHVRLGQGVYAQMIAPPVTRPQKSTATGIPQEYTVGDVANFYQVKPLYQGGIKGQGRTIGIMTLANFNVADAYAYWQMIGLKVKHHRITKVMVDGGTPVATHSDDAETSLDVEQAGGLAPRAEIRVYIAPPNLNSFQDLIYTAVSENLADTLSISWGEAEEDYFPVFNGGVDTTPLLRAIHQALMEAAAQGQSVFASAGDWGAYDLNIPQTGLVPPAFSVILSVDAPASDPYITAAGGTTVAATIPGSSAQPGSTCPNVVVQQEQVWGWDYLQNAWGICLSLPPNAYFPIGGGGGVSSFWPMPYYQQSVPGIELTQPGQSLICFTAAACSQFNNNPPPQTLLTLPANFAGRNLPDLSLNADPATGYIVVDCTDFPAPANPGCAITGWGGTSFVAPQLNGITALIDQAAGSRIGLLNPVIYTEQQIFGYGSFTPFNDITAGDNWFYNGIPGYDDGAGIGSLNATNLGLTYVFLNSLNMSLGQR